MIRETILNVVAWVFGLLLLAVILYGCVVDAQESGKRSNFVEQCTIDGLRVEQVYGTSGWPEDVYCFDSDDNMVRQFDGLGTKGNR